MYPRSTIVNESEFKPFKRVHKLPKLRTIFKMERSPYDSDPRVADWCQQVFDYSLMDEHKFRKIKVITIFATYFYPFCDKIERFEQVVKIFLLFFVLDDHTECEWGDVARNGEKARLIWDQAILALEKIERKENKLISMSSWKPYTVQWFAVLEHICSDLNQVSKARLLRVMRDYCLGNIAESEKIEANYQFKDLEEMLKIRRNSIACYCVYALLEYTDNIPLTDEEWDEPLFQHFLLMATDAIIYNNDVVSFEKEWVEQNKQLERMFNVVARTALLDKSTIEAALEKIASLSIEYETKAFEGMVELNKKDWGQNMKLFIERVAIMVGGHYQVGNIIDRYNKIYE